MKLEAKRYFNSSSDGNQNGVKPILDIWSNIINNEDAFKRKKISEDFMQVELTD